MKNYILLLIAVVLALGVAGCKDKSAGDNEKEKVHVQTESSPLNELREKIRADGKLMGVAYLGWIEGDAETAKAELAKLDYIDDISFVKDINEYTENEGYRMYAIIPADNGVTISVCKCEFDDNYMPYDGEEFIKANGPVLVRGNISDTIPNLYIVAEKGSEKVCYTPVRSGMDGRLENNENKVYDFTPYNKMVEFSGVDKLPEAVFCGSWTTIEIVAGEERVLILNIEPDGAVKYSYGIGNSEILEQFEGTWELDGDILNFSMMGELVDGVDAPLVPEPYDCNPSFTWEVNPGGLELTHIDGDEILFGTKGKTFEFYENQD